MTRSPYHNFVEGTTTVSSLLHRMQIFLPRVEVSADDLEIPAEEFDKVVAATRDFRRSIGERTLSPSDNLEEQIFFLHGCLLIADQNKNNPIAALTAKVIEKPKAGANPMAYLQQFEGRSYLWVYQRIVADLRGILETLKVITDGEDRPITSAMLHGSERAYLEEFALSLQ